MMTAEAKAAWARNRRRQMAYGRWAPTEHVDPTPVRNHIARLREFGLSLESIARLAGEHPSSLSTLTQPNNLAYAKTITKERAERILAVRFDLDAIPDDNRVSNTSTRRRIQALMCNGWPLRYLAQRLGVTPQAVHGYANRGALTAANARAIRGLYDELWGQQGPNERVRRHAARMGWVPPLAWDESALDDPDATPDVGTETLTMTERHAENVEDLLTHDPSATTHQLADRLGISANGLQVALTRAGRDDLREQLNRNAELQGHTVRRRAS